MGTVQRRSRGTAEEKYYGTREFYLNEIDYYLIRRVVAVSHRSYFRKCVYVEVEGMKPTGVYNFPVEPQIERRGYAEEEYGVYGFFRKRYVTREEYDDGATIVRGKVVDLSGRVRLRIRKLSRYNFLIVSHASPVNNNSACDELDDLLDSIINGSGAIEELSHYVFKLPKNDMDF